MKFFLLWWLDGLNIHIFFKMKLCRCCKEPFHFNPTITKRATFCFCVCRCWWHSTYDHGRCSLLSSCLWSYNSSIAGILRWLSEANISRCHSEVWNLYPTTNTFTGVLYDLSAVALHIYLNYYNNILFALFNTMLHFQLS